MSPIPTTYATIEVQTERLGELHMLLNSNGFQLRWVKDSEPERWQLTDEPQADEDAGE